MVAGFVVLLAIIGFIFIFRGYVISALVTDWELNYLYNIKPRPYKNSDVYGCTLDIQTAYHPITHIGWIGPSYCPKSLDIDDMKLNGWLDRK